MIERRKSRIVTAGNLKIGGESKISVQSMLNVPAEDIKGNVNQAVALEKAGCEIIRLTVPNVESVKTLYAVKENVK
ncbi:MAG: flavodoxin-dependent (E)-4-hydroxy-3-methylbut-2-enyl-diphosphate synthase, partial [Oscillospiraceae bacterium]